MITHSPSTAHHSTLRITFLFLSLISFCVSCGVSPTQNNAVAEAFERHQSNTQVEGEGVVSKILSDDTTGLPHQQFIVRLPSGQTVLIEHNTDVAPRIDDLKQGDTVSFLGEYIWNDKGGLVHWTHHDPTNRHPAGWLRHNGRMYQ